MADPLSGLDNLAEVSDIVQRKKGLSTRMRNEAIRQGVQDPTNFQTEFAPQINQAQQPTDFYGAGRKEFADQNFDLSLPNLFGEQTQTIDGKKYYYGDYDPSKVQYGLGDYTTQDIGQGKYNILGKEGNVLGTGYKSVLDTINELAPGKYQTGFGGGLADWEVLGQILSGGSPAARQQWGGMPINSASEQISGANTLYGSTPVFYDGKLLGYKSNFGAAPGWEGTASGSGGQDQVKWNPFGYQATHSGKSHAWSTGLGRQIDPNAYQGLVQNLGNFDYFAPLSNVEKLPGWTNVEGYQHQDKDFGFNKSVMGPINSFAESVAKWTDPGFYKAMGGGTDKSLWNDLTNEGLYSAIFNKADPVLDKLLPEHNWTQENVRKALGKDTQKETFNTVAPIVLAALTYGMGSGASAGATAAGEGAAEGAAAATAAEGAGTAASGTAAGTGAATTGSAAAAGTQLNTLGRILQGVQAAQSASTGDYVGAIMSGLGAANINPAASLAKQLPANISPAAARMISNFAVNAAVNAARGGDPRSALASALFSTAGTEAGDYLTKATQGSLGAIGSGILGGATRGGISSLYNPNDMLKSAVSSGLAGGLAGMFTPENATPQQKQNTQKTAQSAVDLAKLFVKR